MADTAPTAGFDGIHSVVWRSGALGDFVATLPVLHRLAEVGPVAVVGPTRWRPLFDAARWVDVDGVVATGWLAGRARVQVPLGVAWTAVGADALRAVGVAEVLAGTPMPAPGVSISDHLWAPIAPRFGPRDRDPRLAPTADRLAAMHDYIGWTVISPGSGGVRKRWPVAQWREVAARIRGPVLWVGGPLEAGEPGWGAPRRDDLGPADLIALASRCRCWLGPDSGPSHLAAAAGARVGVLFVGATDPRSWAPPGAQVFGSDARPDDLAAFAAE